MRKEVSRSLANGDYIVARCELRQNDARGLSDGFSVTGELYEGRSNMRGRTQAEKGLEPAVCGCIHNEILRAFPKLAPLVKVHLADPSGIPMHAVANGWYFYSGKARAYEETSGYGNREGLSDHDRAARALHIPPADLPEGLDEEGFKAFADGLSARWEADANEARKVLESL